MLSTWRLQQQQWQLDLLWATLHKQKHRRRRRRMYKPLRRRLTGNN